MASRETIAYFHSQEIGGFYYGALHPMKPHRLCLTHSLVTSYGLHERMQVFKLRKATDDELAGFHSRDYIDFLKRVMPGQACLSDDHRRFNLEVHEDVPVFDGLFEFCQMYCGGSIDAARRLNAGLCDHAINWSGGLHHAHKAEASGFCYMNDIVLAIVELLRYHPRVLYIDVDVHHGDGVQDAFFMSDRVMTVSFHKYGDNFFPGTGRGEEIGIGPGKNFSINVPLRDGIDDKSYHYVFKPVIREIMAHFQASVIVLQCGADSLGCDRLGCFNLTLRGHGECVRFCKSFGVPVLLLGGGGYTVANVARCWAYETSVLLGEELRTNDLPGTEYLEFFGPEFKLHCDNRTGIANLNTRTYLDKIKTDVLQQLKLVEIAPSVQMAEIPPSFHVARHERTVDDCDPDDRFAFAKADTVQRHGHEADFYENERDNVGEIGAVSDEAVAALFPATAVKHEHTARASPPAAAVVMTAALEAAVATAADAADAGEPTTGGYPESAQPMECDLAPGAVEAVDVAVDSALACAHTHAVDMPVTTAPNDQGPAPMDL